MITQTTALFVDAYRELNAKKLFWITMVLSVLVVAVFAMFGLNEQGLTFLHWEFEFPMFNSTIIPPEVFYKFAFANLGIPIWLTWAATILALVSTAGIFPDFVTSGSIELVLSKPVGRLRLFITKYITGLFFVTLQVFAFTGASFLVIGLRGDSWDFSLFLAVPIVVVFFSYLFCVCALLGLVTRSTIAALLLTVLLWLAMFGINVADGIMLGLREGAIVRSEDATLKVERQTTAAEEELARLEEEGEPIDVPEGADVLEVVNPFLKQGRADLEQADSSAQTWTRWAAIVTGIKTVLPKTGETVGLLERHLLTDEERALFQPEGPENNTGGFDDPRVSERVDAAIRERSIAWIVGTSLIFEVVILAIAGFIFVRRDC